MITFLKANLSSIISSLFDYLVHIILVSYFNVDVVIASATGTVCGGVTNFIIGRYWVFESNAENIQQQAKKYAFIWIGNLVLNTVGVYFFAKILHVHYAVSKIIVSLIVAFGYNYPLQKNFVFKKIEG